MKDILREYLKYLNEIISRCETIIDKYNLTTCLTSSEKGKLLDIIVNFENLRLWGKGVLYGENDQPYNGSIGNGSDVLEIKKLLAVKLGLEILEEKEVEFENEHVLVISRRELPKICCLTRETFNEPVSHRYEGSNMKLDICRNHVFEKEAILNYLGNRKKKACPIAGCGYMVVKRYLREDIEVMEQIHVSVKKE
ncbi:hypothetical protein FG379_001714 [Cryptosporidium bovis]|uniref:uncharacterized protein n=1 Tax=Cryptosporidium bovis TaxID=310047 RepID=UPI00351A5AE3|nr:hypothetical protein FG379_001714 [Cryptosporidium bovis]